MLVLEETPGARMFVPEGPLERNADAGEAPGATMAVLWQLVLFELPAALVSENKPFYKGKWVVSAPRVGSHSPRG